MKTIDGLNYVRIDSTNRPAAKQYSIIALRPVNKGGFSTASMINNFGQIVGHGSDEMKAQTKAFAWSNEYGLIVDLGSVYSGDSFATNINDKGVIVGYTSTPEGSLRGYLLGQGQMFDVGLLATVTYDEAFSVATDINDDGAIAGYSHNNDSKVHAFYWEHARGMIDLGSLCDGQSYAYSLNDRGTVVGWSQVTTKAAYRAFTWDETNGMVEMSEPLEGSSVAYSINNQGVIAGASANGPLLTLLEACVWNKSGHRMIGTLSGFQFSACQCLNETGQIVGWSYPSTHCDVKYGRAFIWDQVKGLQDLNHLIPAGTGWMLHKALGINDGGDIVGCGTLDGKLQAFLLTPIDYGRNITSYLDIQQLNLITNQKTGIVYRTLIIKNKSHRPINGPLHILFRDLTPWIKVLGASGEYDNSPFRTVKIDALAPNSTVSTTVQFSNPNGLLMDYECECYAGSF